MGAILTKHTILDDIRRMGRLERQKFRADFSALQGRYFLAGAWAAVKALNGPQTPYIEPQGEGYDYGRLEESG